MGFALQCTLALICCLLLDQACANEEEAERLAYCRNLCTWGRGGNLCKCNAQHFAGKRFRRRSQMTDPTKFSDRPDPDGTKSVSNANVRELHQKSLEKRDPIKNYFNLLLKNRKNENTLPNQNIHSDHSSMKQYVSLAILPTSSNNLIRTLKSDTAASMLSYRLNCGTFSPPPPYDSHSWNKRVLRSASAQRLNPIQYLGLGRKRSFQMGIRGQNSAPHSEILVQMCGSGGLEQMLRQNPKIIIENFEDRKLNKINVDDSFLLNALGEHGFVFENDKHPLGLVTDESSMTLSDKFIHHLDEPELVTIDKQDEHKFRLRSRNDSLGL